MTEFSSGAVLYTKSENDILYCLVIRISDGYACFPKGHIENNETEIDTALREIREETCVNADIVPGFRMETEYIMENGIKKHVTYYLAKYTDQTPHDNPDEPLRVEVLSYGTALERLRFPDTRRILKAADEFIKSNF